MADDTAEELNRFRQQWQEEVEAKSKGSNQISKNKTGPKATSSAAKSLKLPPPSASVSQEPIHDEHEGFDGGYHDLQNKDETSKLGLSGTGKHPSSKAEPSSALEHYERAVEKESAGNLGDSLNHYRKAYKVARFLAILGQETDILYSSMLRSTEHISRNIFQPMPPSPR